MRLGLFTLLLVAGCGAPPPAACVAHPPDRAAVLSLAQAAVAYGQQFVVACSGDAALAAPTPSCAALSAMSPGLHRDNWAANYLDYDDPLDPSTSGLLTQQRYVTLMLADPSAYKGQALLSAYALDGDSAHLTRFTTAFLGPWLGKQLPSRALGLGATQRFQAHTAPDDALDVTLDATGAFVQAATLDAGADGVLGSGDDVLRWRFAGHSPLHTAVLASALAQYARLFGDTAVDAPLDAAGSFLLRVQRSDGAWAYALAPADGPPDFLTTALCGTALDALAHAPVAHASDFAAAAARATAWLGQSPADSVGAGAAIALLLDAGDGAAAVRVADAFLGRMTTSSACGFGDHRFAADAHALGGIASDGITLQSPWAAVYGVPALLQLAAAVGDPRYRDAADLLVAWLVDKLDRARAFADPVRVQDLRGGLAAVSGGGWWGLAPEGYEPDVADDTLAHRVLDWVAAPSPALDLRPTSWLEQHAAVDFERILYERVRADPYFAHVSFDDPWSGGAALPGDLGAVSPGVNPLPTDDAALALLGWLQLR